MKMLEVPPIGWKCRVLDCLITPILILFFGKKNVTGTRPWHIWLAGLKDMSYLDRKKMVITGPMEVCDVPVQEADADVTIANYIVLTAREEDLKRGVLIGWIVLRDQKESEKHSTSDDEKEVEIHRRVIHEPVRVIIGPYGMMFFGIRPSTGEQVQVFRIGKGHLSQRHSEHERLVLL
jgi:hypothetical protein